MAGIVTTAVLLGLYSRGGNAYLLGFVGLVPWLLTLDATRTAAGAARSGLAMSIAFVAAVFAWFGFAVAGYLGISEATGFLILLATAPLLQPQLLAFALVRHIAGRHHGPVVRALAGAAAWVATEWLVPRLFDDTLGHGLHPSYALRQLADLGGAPGITVLLILINECIAAAIARRGEGARALLRPLVVVATVLVLMIGYGTARLSMPTVASGAADPLLRVGMVQSNIVDYERLRREMGAYEVVRHVLDTHYAMSREAIERHRVDALLWSETVYPTTYGHPKSEGGAELDREIQAFVSSAGVPLVFGTYDLDEVGEYNAAAFLEPARTAPLGFYRKTDLFPLTEYVPQWLDGPTTRRWLPWTGSWQPGDGARVFPLRLSGGREIPVLPMICLDDTDAGLAIDGARLGALAIVGMSNDSWFTAYPVGANLHLRVAAFRSIETRLPQLRVTSNGTSAVIDATGTIVAATAMGEQKLLIGEVSVRQPPATLMVAWGDWVGRTAFVLLLLQAMFWVGKALKRRKHSVSSSPTAPTAHAALRAGVIVMGPVWRIAAGLLRVFAFGSLFWMGAALLFQSEQMNPLAQMRMFAALFLAPLAAAWCIGRAFAATARIEGDALVLEQRERRTEIPLKHIVALEPWALPLPSTGVWLRMASGRRWFRGLGLDDPAALVDALIHAGAPASVAEASTGRALAYARTRLAVTRHRLLDHPLVKFVLFPLVPALPAFRLHQHIAFGGTFGEYHTYGLQAYLTALGIWWVSWAIGLVIFAALLRVIIEAGTWLSLVLRRESAVDTRRGLESLGRILFYVGVPAWLVIRFWP